MNEASGEYPASKANTLLPHSLEAEQAVIGGLILAGEKSFDQIASLVRYEDFYKQEHRTIFAALTRLAEEKQPFDPITLCDDLDNRRELDKAGGPAYISDLANNTPSSANVVAYARIVRERATLRQLIEAADLLKQRSFNPDGSDPKDVLGEAEKRLIDIAEGGPKDEAMRDSDTLLKDALDHIQALSESDSDITGVSTGFTDLDGKTSGWQKSDLIIVAARPSMGKTAFALNMVEHALFHTEQPVIVFSLEMPSQALMMRLLASVGRIELKNLRDGKLSAEDWDKLSRAATRIKGKKLFIDDTPGLTPTELRARTRRLVREQDSAPALIMLDYLQLMRVPGNSDNRVQEISEISRSLKQLAREFECPVIALSQLNRGVEQRPNKRPMNSDLRECVSGETRVILADGKPVSIRDLVGTQPQLFSLNAQQKFEEAKSDQVWPVGVKPLFKVQLASGRAIRVTAEHLLLGAKGWTRCSELNAGDRLALARKIPQPQQPLEWPDLRVALLGQMIGDGSFLKGQPMRYTTESEDNSEIVRQAAQAEFGCSVKRYAGRSSWHQMLISGNGNRWHPAGVNQWLRELGIFGCRSHEKRIPEQAFQLSDRQIALLLQHLWAADGTIFTRKSGSRGSHAVQFSTNSPQLAQDVALLLQRLGIIARIRMVQKSGYRPGYLVMVLGSEMQTLFLDLVGAFGPRVAQAEKLRQALVGVTANTNADTLPNEVFEQVKARMAELGVSQRQMAAARGKSYGGTSHFNFAPSRDTLRSYADYLDDPQLKQMCSNDLFWDRVIEVQADGEEEVYDLTVPGTANWIADGIVSHNSGAIEQDADVIVFLYRDEYYNEDSPEKGIAEVIIGKQRNGEIGTCKLQFEGKYTRFNNLARDYFSGEESFGH